MIYTTVSFEDPGQHAIVNVPDGTRDNRIRQTMKPRQLLQDSASKPLAV
jgi:hypothetical protein